MSAIPEDFIKKTTQLSEDVTRPFPNSRKIYVEGSRPDIRVPMRQVEQADTAASFGAEKNPPITVYDTSGPYSDPEASIDLLAGLADVRAAGLTTVPIPTYLTAPVRPLDRNASPTRNWRTCVSSISARHVVRWPAGTCRKCTMHGRA